MLVERPILAAVRRVPTTRPAIRIDRSILDLRVQCERARLYTQESVFQNSPPRGILKPLHPTAGRYQSNEVLWNARGRSYVGIYSVCVRGSGVPRLSFSPERGIFLLSGNKVKGVSAGKRMPRDGSNTTPLSR